MKLTKWLLLSLALAFVVRGQVETQEAEDEGDVEVAAPEGAAPPPGGPQGIDQEVRLIGACIAAAVCMSGAAGRHHAASSTRKRREHG